MRANPSELSNSASPSPVSTFDGSVQRNSAGATRMSATRRHSSNDDTAGSKRRRIDRACDACRRRKTKCDGPKMPKNICTNCTQGRKHCTYVEESKPRGPPKAYITSLEDKVEEMEAILKMLHPETDLDAELGPPILRDSWRSDFEPPSSQPIVSKSSKSPSSLSSKISLSLPTTETEPKRSPLLPINLYPDSADRRRSTRSMSPSTDLSTSSHERRSHSISDGASDLCSDSEDSCDDLHTGIRHIGIHSMNRPMDTSIKFLGKSSGRKYVRRALKMKTGFIEQLQAQNSSKTQPSGDLSETHKEIRKYPRRREQFWTTPSWQLSWEGSGDNLSHLLPDLTAGLPADDLARALIDIFFLHTNSQYPLLHRPTFERQWQSGLQTRDVWFSCLCFSIFAVASRWSDDPRVLSGLHASGSADGGNHPSWSEAGSKYCDLALLVQQVPCGMMTGATLAQIQAYAALSIYLRGTSDSPLAWLCISMGIRKAQDLGVHRKRMYGNKLTVDDEQWKRAFWILIVLDRINSASLGRACCAEEADYDLDLPVEVDDEYWENKNPKLAFQQPSKKPALVAAFNSLIQLTRVVSIALRTIYAVDKTKLRIGVPKGPNWQTEVIMQLNTMMTEWVDSLPQHLKWTPVMRDLTFANQAATLHITYYLNQILIYRQFIPNTTGSGQPTRHSETIPFPASAICTHAAKECAKILDTQIQRGISNILILISVANICGAVLASNIWDLKLKDRAQQMAELDDVKPQFLATIDSHKNDISTFMKALERTASRWELASVTLQRLKESLPNPVDDLQGLVQMDESDSTPLEFVQFSDLQSTHISTPSVPFAISDRPPADVPPSWPLDDFASHQPHTQYPHSQLPYSSHLHPSFSSPYMPTLTGRRYASSLPSSSSPRHERLPRDLSRMRAFTTSADDLAAPMSSSVVGNHLPSISRRATARSIRNFHNMKVPDAPGNWLQPPAPSQSMDQWDSAGHFPNVHGRNSSWGAGYPHY